MRSLILLLCLVGLSHACSCWIDKSIVPTLCSDFPKNIIHVKIKEVAKEEPKPAERRRRQIYATTTPPSEGPGGFVQRRQRTVVAVIMRVYKGSAVVGDLIKITSGLIESMCGWGHHLYPGKTLILKTDNLEETDLDMCEYQALNHHDYTKVFEWHDCSCGDTCTLKGPEKMYDYVGDCDYQHAYCVKDDEGTCMWQNVYDASLCYRPSWYD